MATVARAASGRRTRETVREALLEYAQRYENPTSAAFSPCQARWRGRPELIDRYHAGRTDGSPWPSLNGIKSLYGGSFNAAMTDAGLPINTPGPPSQRRLHAEPLERPVPDKDDEISRLRMQRNRANERAMRAAKRSGELAEKLRRRPVPKVIVREARPRPRVIHDDALAKELATSRATITRLRQRLGEVAASADVVRKANATDQASASDVIKTLKDRVTELEHAVRDAKADQLSAERRQRMAESKLQRLEREHVEAPKPTRHLTVQEPSGDVRPGGPGPWVEAVQAVFKARVHGGREELAAALGEEIRAARRWRDLL